MSLKSHHTTMYVGHRSQLAIYNVQKKLMYMIDSSQELVSRKTNQVHKTTRKKRVGAQSPPRLQPSEDMSLALWNIATGVVYLFFCLGLGLGGRLALGRLCRRGFGRRRLCFSLCGCGSNRSLGFSLGCRLLGLTGHSL